MRWSYTLRAAAGVPCYVPYPGTILRITWDAPGRGKRLILAERSWKASRTPPKTVSGLPTMAVNLLSSCQSCWCPGEKARGALKLLDLAERQTA